MSYGVLTRVLTLRQAHRRKDLTSPIWTVVYTHKGYLLGCEHIEFGHPKGQTLPFKLVLRLARKALPKGYKMHSMWPDRYKSSGAVCYWIRTI